MSWYLYTAFHLIDNNLRWKSKVFSFSSSLRVPSTVCFGRGSIRGFRGQRGRRKWNGRPAPSVWCSSLRLNTLVYSNRMYSLSHVSLMYNKMAFAKKKQRAYMHSFRWSRAHFVVCSFFTHTHTLVFLPGGAACQQTAFHWIHHSVCLYYKLKELTPHWILLCVTIQS